MLVLNGDLAPQSVIALGLRGGERQVFEGHFSLRIIRDQEYDFDINKFRSYSIRWTMRRRPPRTQAWREDFPPPFGNGQLSIELDSDVETLAAEVP